MMDASPEAPPKRGARVKKPEPHIVTNVTICGGSCPLSLANEMDML